MRHPTPETWPPELEEFIDRRGSSAFAAAKPAPPEVLREIDSIVGEFAKPGHEHQLKAALLLVAGDLDGSHELSQRDPSDVGSYLHGMMHRREGDYGNAKYWFRRAASVDVSSAVTEHLDYDCRRALGGSPNWRFTPESLTDLLESYRQQQPANGRVPDDPTGKAIEQTAFLEWHFVVERLITTA